MGWISNLFNKSTSSRVELPSNSTGFQDMDDVPKPLRLKGTDLRAARERINSVAMRTAKACGIPPLWLSFEVITIGDSENAYFQLQIVIQHWDDYLAAHSYAFERAVMKRLLAEDQRVGRAVRAVLWRTAFDAGCPYDDMPDPHSWTTEAIKKRSLARERANQPQREPQAMASAPNPAAAQAARPAPAKDKYADLLDEDSRFGKTQPFKGTDFAATEPMGLDTTKIPPQ